MKREWELMHEADGERTHRLRIPGGWLYRYTEWSIPDDEHKHQMTAIVFVPRSAAGHAITQDIGD
jgi:hypothetical protein